MQTVFKVSIINRLLKSLPSTSSLSIYVNRFKVSYNKPFSHVPVIFFLSLSIYKPFLKSL